MNPKRIVVFAYSSVGHACLNFLIDHGEKIVHIYTHSDKPGEQIWFDSVKTLARGHNIPFTLDADLTSLEEQKKIKELAPDLIFSFYYRNLIPMSILSLAPLGAYNMHGSLLPKYRGRAPVNWAVLKGEKQTGATLHVMEEKPDAGDIVGQEAVPIFPDETALQVQEAVTKAAVNILRRVIGPLKAGEAVRRPQNHLESSYFGGRRPEDGLIDWQKPAQEIHNLIRAVTHPFPGAYTDERGKKTYIWASRLPQRRSVDSNPGRFRSDGDHLYVECGDGWLLEILSLQREGQSEMSAAEFLKREKV